MTTIKLWSFVIFLYMLKIMYLIEINKHSLLLFFLMCIFALTQDSGKIKSLDFLNVSVYKVRKFMTNYLEIEKK